MPYLGHLATVASLAGVALMSSAPATAQSANDPLLARNLAATCANCHGTNGAARGDMRPLAGQPADKLIAMMADFKSGAQAATIMHQIAKGYTDEQIRLIAGYLSQKPAK